MASVSVLTLGAPNLDYAASGASTCAAGQSYSSGQVCTVSVTFTPRYPGVRAGAAVLLDASNNVLGVSYLSGIGLGALGVMVPGTAQTVAGTGAWVSVYDGQPATSADLDLPLSAILDGSGNMYIADSAHNRVREVSASTGLISTIAGNGSATYSGDHGWAGASTLNTPSSVALDGAGNLYIADTGNNVIREILASTGVIVTFAGDGTSGSSGDNGPASAASLNGPAGVTVAASGDVYIADTRNHRIRRVSALTGIITTVAGNGATSAGGAGSYSGDGGPATSAGLNTPFAVAFDPAGVMYIPDSANNRIRKVDSLGIITTFAGTGVLGFSGDYGPAAQANLYSPSGAACDAAGNLYLSDTQNNRVRKVNAATGVISTVAGNGLGKFSGDGGSASAAGVYGPYGLFVDGAGNLLVADYFDHRIREVPGGKVTLTFSTSIREDQVSPPQTQYIENDGNAALTLTSIAPDANAAVDLASTSCSVANSLAVDSSCRVAAEFAPTQVGDPVTGNILLTGNPADSPLDIQVVGQALPVNATSVALISSPNPSTYTQSVSMIATVTTGNGKPTGTVTFTDAGVPLGSPVTLNNASATYATPALAVGVHTLAATYNGDTEHFASTSPNLTQVVNQATTTTLISSQNPSALGSSVTFTAVVASRSGGLTPDGEVVFYDGSNVIGASTLNPAGVATVADANLTAGMHSITAVYGGDAAAYILGSTSTALTQDAQAQSTTTLTSSSNPSVYGIPITLTATVSASGASAPVGSVSFLDAGRPIGTATLAGTSGTASLTIATLGAGSHSIVATYAPNANDATSSSSPLLQAVQQTTDVTTETYSPSPAVAGKSVAITATVSVTKGAGTPSGQLTFTDGVVPLGSAPLSSSGTAMIHPLLAPGAHSIIASYDGDTNDGPSTSALLSVNVELATTAVTISSTPNPATALSPFTVRANVSGNGGMPGGTVSFSADGVVFAAQTLDAGGSASAACSSLAVGTHAITVSYSGDKDDAASTSSTLTEIIGAIPTTTTVGFSTAAGAKPQLILVASVIGAAGPEPTGRVTFEIGSTVIGSAVVDASGSATFEPDLNSGQFDVTAVYSGDAVHAPSTSLQVAVTSPGSGMDVTLNPASVKVATGQNVTLSLVLSSTNGFTDQVGLGCASLPAVVTCHFSSNSTVLSANGTQPLELTIDTNAPLSGGTQASHPSATLSQAMAAGMLPLCGWILWWSRRRSTEGWRVLLFAVASVSLLGAMSCSGVTTNSAAPGTYTIQVVATGYQSALTRSVNLTVTITK